jgi:hypothetical protein
MPGTSAIHRFSRAFKSACPGAVYFASYLRIGETPSRFMGWISARAGILPFTRWVCKALRMRIIKKESRSGITGIENGFLF